MKRFTHSSSSNRRFLTKGVSLAIAPAMILAFFCPQVHGEKIGDYSFQGNFDNSAISPESLGSLTVIGSEEGSHSFTPGGWSWTGATTPGIGLNLEVGTVISSYSVAIAFQFSEVTEYAKLLTFGSLETDLGLYVVNGGLSLINEDGFGHGGGSIHANTTALLIMTRTVDGSVKIYLDGNTNSLIGIEDTDSVFTLQSQLNFFIDDIVTGSEFNEFSPNGSVSRIMVWNSALTTEEISDAFKAIPEPSVTALITGLGFAGFALNWARRKRNS